VKSTESKDSDWSMLVGFIVICIGISLVWYLTPNLAKYLLEIKSTVSCENTGIFGDTFGMTNTLFSGLAFAALITALLLQKKELGLQRQELKYTQEIMDEQREQLEKQAKSLEKQNFESTFLQLLKLMREVRDTATYKHRGTVFTETQAVNLIAEALKNTVQRTTAESLQNEYASFAKDYEKYLDWYFGTISEVLEFVHRSDIGEKTIYFRLIRTVVSTADLAILFYHQLSSKGRPEVKSLVEKYGLFTYIPDWIPPTHRDFYAPSAFEDRLSYDT
jgi:hypothetical protein